MKKNRLFVLGIITMFVAILSLTLVSGTMARYTSTVTGFDTAKIAKWAFTLSDGGTEESVTEDTNYASFNLFNTILDTKDSNDEIDVDDDLLAPGTKGSFKIVVTNNSEVNAEFSITFDSKLTVDGTEYTTYLPIKFTLKDEGGNILAESTQLSSFNNEIKSEAISMNGAKATYTIEWEWVFEGENGADTQLGILAETKTVQYITDVRVVFDQVD